jgi:hypothetical protein
MLLRISSPDRLRVPRLALIRSLRGAELRRRGRLLEDLLALGGEGILEPTVAAKGLLAVISRGVSCVSELTLANLILLPR